MLQFQDTCTWQWRRKQIGSGGWTYSVSDIFDEFKKKWLNGYRYDYV